MNSNLVFSFYFFYFLCTQRELDIAAAEVGRRQDESEAARKQLVEQSREFKKTASEVTHVSIRARFYYNCVGLQPAESPCVLGENFVHYYAGPDRMMMKPTFMT